MSLYGAALGQLDRRGWHKGWFGSDEDDPDNCPVDLPGAIQAACCGNPFIGCPRSDTYIEFIARRISRRRPPFTIVGIWNDHHSTTVEDVKALLADLDAIYQERAAS